MRFAIAAIILVLSAGCGRSTGTVVVDDPVQDSLEGVKECVREAIESVHAETAPPSTDEDGESADIAAPLPAALGAVVRAAQDLVSAAAGKPTETGAKAIL